MQSNLDLNTQMLANKICETVFTGVEQTRAHRAIVEYFRGIEVGLASGEKPTPRLNGKTLFSQVWTVESEGVQVHPNSTLVYDKYVNETQRSRLSRIVTVINKHARTLINGARFGASRALDSSSVEDETAAYSLQMHNFSVSPSAPSGSTDFQGNLSPAGYNIAWPSSPAGYPVASSSSSRSQAPSNRDSSFAGSSFGIPSVSPSVETESYALNSSALSDFFTQDNAALFSSVGYNDTAQGGSSYTVRPDDLPVTLPVQGHWQSTSPHSYYGDGNAADNYDPDESAMEYGYGGSVPSSDEFPDLFPESGSGGRDGRNELDWMYFGFK